MKTLQLIKDLLQEKKHMALTYIQQVLENSADLDEIEYDPFTGVMKLCYKKDKLYIVLKETPKDFSIKVFQGRKQIFRGFEVI